MWVELCFALTKPMRHSSLLEVFQATMSCYPIRRSIMNNENDLYAAGRLIHWALRPTERPTAQSEYRELLARYLENLQFRDIVWAIASGLGLYIINASSLGIVLAPLEGSIFMPKASDYRPSGSAEERLLDGLIHIAIIATIYPRAQDLEEDTVIARLPITITVSSSRS